ncbi:MAG: DUF433 domain-containing protein [Caldilineaceae bacterium]
MIAGSRLKVDLVTEHVEWGWSAEEIAYQHPPLTLGQVYSALIASLRDHREQINEYRSQIAEEAITAPGATGSFQAGAAGCAHAIGYSNARRRRYNPCPPS